MERKKILDGAIVGGAVALYCLLTFGGITRWSIWFDEAFSAYLMRFDVANIIKYTAADVHPPFYYLVLKLWTMFFGTSDLALRSMSAVSVALAIALAYFFLKNIFGRRAATISVLFLSISPLLIRFGQEARMYGLVVLITTAATWLLWSAQQAPTRKKWIGYGVLVSLGMWTNYFTALVWLAHWLWRLLVIKGSRRLSKEVFHKFFTRDWIIAHAVAVIGFLAWLPALAIQFGTVQFAGFWIRIIDVDTIPNYLTDNLLFLDHYEVQGWLALAVWVILGLMIWLGIAKYKTLLPHEKSGFRLIAILASVPVLLLIALSLPPLRSVFMDRYLLSSTFWLFVLGAVIVSIRPHSQRLGKASWLAGILVVMASVYGVYNVYTLGNFNRSSWETMAMKPVIAQVNQKSSTKIPIVTDSPWRFYEAIQYDTTQNPVYFINENPVFGSYNMLRDSDFRKIKDFEAFVRDNPVIWYVGIYHDDTPRMPTGSWKVLESIKGPQTKSGSGTTYAYKLQRL